jgi:hypothetical protein
MNLRLEDPRDKHILVVGTCQAGGLAACLTLLLPQSQVTSLHWQADGSALDQTLDAAATSDAVVTCAPQLLIDPLTDHARFERARWLKAPMMVFGGFHPDLVSVTRQGVAVPGVAGAPYQSAIAYWCWRHRLDLDVAAALFTPETMRALGYDQTWAQATAWTREVFARTAIGFAEAFLPLQASGQAFMHTFNHPSISAIAAFARPVARRLGASASDLDVDLERLAPDALAQDVVWPLYPGVGEALGLPSSSLWKYGQTFLDLKAFLQAQFTALDGIEEPLVCALADDDRFHATMQARLAGLQP